MRPRAVAFVLAPLFVAAVAGCPRSRPSEGRGGVPDASAPAVDAAQVTALDAGAPAFDDGAHDYRGTLAKATSVSMHLVREGTKVSGAYAYTEVGRSIGLDGAVAADGSLTLTEFVGRDATGHLVLRPDGRNLVGTWSDLSRKKTFPITLTPSPPLRALAGDAGAAPSLNAQAEQCLADLACPAAEAERLFLAADDEHEIDFDCARFLDGVGMKRDPARARACYERLAGHAKCEGGSPDLSIAELATLRIDGVGGKRDIPAVRATLAKCFKDVTVDSLLDRARLVEISPAAPPVSLCKDLGSTQFVFDECTSRDRARQRDRANILAKTVAESLDDKGRDLFRAATKAFDAFVRADGAHILAVFDGGSLRFAIELGREAEHFAERAKDLAGFKTFAAPALTPADVVRAHGELTSALAAVDLGTEPSSEYLERIARTLAEAQRAWTRYRDAELALYVHVFGGAQGAPRVRDALTVTLESRRAKTCAAPEP